MADIPARTELEVTTGPIRGSRKIHVGARLQRGDARDRPRAALAASRRCASTTRSGPYTDPDAAHRHHGRPPRAAPRLDPRPRRRRGGASSARSRPEDNGQLGPDRSGGVQPFPNVRRKVLRAKPGANVTPDALCPPRHHHPRDGICRDPRKPRPRSASRPRPRRPGFRRRHPRLRHPRIRPRRGRPRPRDHPVTTSTTPRASRWRSAATSWSRSTPISATAPSPPTSPPRSTRWSGRSAGAPTRSWTSRPAATSTTPANGSSATPRCRSAPSRSTRRSRRSAASPRT